MSSYGERQQYSQLTKHSYKYRELEHIVGILYLLALILSGVGWCLWFTFIRATNIIRGIVWSRPTAPRSSQGLWTTSLNSHSAPVSMTASMTPITYSNPEQLVSFTQHSASNGNAIMTGIVPVPATVPAGCTSTPNLNCEPLDPSYSFAQIYNSHRLSVNPPPCETQYISVHNSVVNNGVLQDSYGLHLHQSPMRGISANEFPYNDDKPPPYNPEYKEK